MLVRNSSLQNPGNVFVHPGVNPGLSHVPAAYSPRHDSNRDPALILQLVQQRPTGIPLKRPQN